MIKTKACIWLSPADRAMLEELGERTEHAAETGLAGAACAAVG
jgi:hypothetical protein